MEILFDIVVVIMAATLILVAYLFTEFVYCISLKIADKMKEKRAERVNYQIHRDAIKYNFKKRMEQLRKEEEENV